MSREFFDSKNVITAIKSVAVNLLTILILSVPASIIWYMGYNMYSFVISLIAMVIIVALYLCTWGYLANKFWKWK